MRLPHVHLLAPIALLALGACGGREGGDAPKGADTAAAIVTPAGPAIARDGAAPRTVAAPAASAAPAAGSPTTAGPAATGGGTAVRAPRHVTLDGIDLTGVGYDRGSAVAPVVVIDFSDFGCPYCAEFTRTTYPALEREYVQTGKVYFKYVPFIVGMFPHAEEATRAVECAAEQGHFWTMADRVYAAQKDWKRASDPRALLGALARADGADTTALSRCYASGRTDARTRRASDIASQAGVRVTPSFIVAGRPVEGALPLADFRKLIEAALLLESTRR